MLPSGQEPGHTIELIWRLLLPVQILQARNVQLEQALRALRQERNALLATLRKHDCVGKSLGATAVLGPALCAQRPQPQHVAAAQPQQQHMALPQQHVCDEPCSEARHAQTMSKDVHPRTASRSGRLSPGPCSSDASAQLFDVGDNTDSNDENCSLSSNKTAVHQNVVSPATDRSAYGQVHCWAAESGSAWSGRQGQILPVAPQDARQYRLRQLQDLADSLLL